MNISKNLRSEKNELLHYFRSRYDEFKKEIFETYGVSQYKLRATAINKRVQETKEALARYRGLACGAKYAEAIYATRGYPSEIL